MDGMNKLEQALCEFYHQEYCFFTSNGTTAMYLLFLALNCQNKKVLYPAISCTNPVNAAIYAGYQVDFCDVNLNDYTIDLKMLENILKTGDIGIVVPTHIYGHIYDREQVQFLCRKYGTFLFEDSAQTIETNLSDVSIVSFGHTKVYESEFGGGVAFMHDKGLLEQLKKLRKKTLISADKNSLFDVYREKYYAIANVKDKGWDQKYKEIYHLQLEAKKYFIYDNVDAQSDILQILQDSKQLLQARIQKAKLYETFLDQRYISLPNINYDVNPVWRFTFMLKGERDLLLEQVRKLGIDISSWYLPLNRIYGVQECCKAEYLSKHVVNLWVDESHSLEQIATEISYINKCLNNLREGNDGK